MTVGANSYRYQYDECSGYDCMTGGFRITGPNGFVVVVDQRDYGQEPCDYQDQPSRGKAEAATKLITDALNGLPGPNDGQDTKRLDFIGRTLHIDATGDEPIYAMFIPGTEGVKSKSDLRGLIDESMKMVENDYLLLATGMPAAEQKP